MTEPNNIEERVSRLERSVAEARKDAAAARILAGGADRDVSEMRTELKAHTQTLNALRTTQVEQGKEIRDLRTETREGFAQLRTEMQHGFSVVAVGMAQINAQLAIAIGESGEAEES